MASKGVEQLPGGSLLRARRRDRLPDSLERAVTGGSMPPFDYLLKHPEARLSEDERQQLADGFKASLAER